MAIESYTTQLERVQSAINAVESGAQSYTLKGRMMLRGDLETLYTREAYLRRMVSSDATGGIVLVGGIPTND